MCAVVVLGFVFSIANQEVGLGNVSKWPILPWVGRKTLTSNQLDAGAVTADWRLSTRSVVNLGRSQVYHTERPPYLFAAYSPWCSASRVFVSNSWSLFIPIWVPVLDNFHSWASVARGGGVRMTRLKSLSRGNKILLAFSLNQTLVRSNCRRNLSNSNQRRLRNTGNTVLLQ